MARSKPVSMLVTYVPRKGREKELLALVEKHFPALQKAGLVTKEPVRLWQARDIRSGRTSFVEMFQWKDEEASGIAHQTPEILALWEPMGAVMEDLKLQEVEPLALGRAKA